MKASPTIAISGKPFRELVYRLRRRECVRSDTPEPSPDVLEHRVAEEHLYALLLDLVMHAAALRGATGFVHHENERNVEQGPQVESFRLLPREQ
jgi:hypothetical protein